MNDPPINPLDEPYKDALVFLEVLRDYIHKNVVRKLTNFTRDDYTIYWREEKNEDDNENVVSKSNKDITAQRGSKILILFNCSPGDGKRSISLAKHFFSGWSQSHLKTLRTGMDLVLRKDAIRIYGIELDNVDVSLYDLKNKPEMQHHEIRVVPIYEVIVTDTTTKKKVTIIVKNADAFTASEIALRRLYGED